MTTPTPPSGHSRTTVTRGPTPWPPATTPFTATSTAGASGRTYRNRRLFVGPGEKLVLLSRDAQALFVWRKFLSRDGQTGVNCALFRNEGAYCGEVKSSRLILAAEVWAWARWPGERLYTYVDARRVRSTQSGLLLPGGGVAEVRGDEGEEVDHLREVAGGVGINGRSTDDQRLHSIVVVSAVTRRPALSPCGAGLKENPFMEEQEGYSTLFYVMLVLGVIGLIGFILVAAGAPGG